MVLCPFVFLYTTPEVPPVKLQPTEVASTHWVPLRVLLSPSVRTYEYADASDRFARQGGFIIKAIIRSVLGKMRFSAIRLIPSESVFSSTTEEFFPLDDKSSDKAAPLTTRLYKWILGDHVGSEERTRPLLLWGLTLGILADFLDQLPPHNAVELWSYPTFTSWDTRFLIHILTLGLKRKNRAKLHGNHSGNQTAVDSETEATPSGDNPWFIGGLSDGMKCDKSKNAKKSYAVSVMLEGYYNMARFGVWSALAARMLASSALILYIIRRYRRRH